MASTDNPNYKENERQQRLEDAGLNGNSGHTQGSLQEENSGPSQGSLVQDENSGRNPQTSKKVILAVVLLIIVLLLAFLLRSCQNAGPDSSASETVEDSSAKETDKDSEDFDWEKAFQEAMAILEQEDEENYPAAVALFKEILEVEPGLVDAWRGLTIIYLRMGEAELAEETLLRGYEITNDDSLRSWAEQLAQETGPEETVPAAEEEQPAPQEEEDLYDGHEPVTLTCTFIPFDENMDWQLSILHQYSSSYLVTEDAHGFRFPEPVEAYNPLTGESDTVTEAIAYFYKNGSYHAWEKDFNIEQGGTYTVTGFWCSPLDLYEEGTWVDDKLFGPRGHNEAGDWYTLYTYGPYCFAVTGVK